MHLLYFYGFAKRRMEGFYALQIQNMEQEKKQEMKKVT